MKWEYQTVKLNITGSWNLSGIDFDVDVVQEFANRLGSEGWELVAAFPVNSGHGQSKEVVFMFKRPFDE